MNLLCESGMPLAQFGVRALCKQEQDSRQKFGVFYTDAEDLVTSNIHRIDLPKDFPQDIYITVDVDGLDPSIMPATGTPAPGGLGYYHTLHLIEHAAQGRRVVGIDIVEFAPNGHTAWDFTVAQITYSLMATAL